MEYTNSASEFVGSTFFSILMVIGVIGIGVILRMTFRSNSEYKYKADE